MAKLNDIQVILEHRIKAAEKPKQATGGINTLGLLGVVFVTLKLCGVINWSWWWVTLPFWWWVPVAVVLLLVIALMFLYDAVHD